ncbi:MAG: hypothetical protein ABR520_08835, partial [Mycobacteriales bacterium]
MHLLAVADEAIGVSILVTTFGFGFRHGVDWDHIAAISDITSSQESGRDAMIYATLYAVGHALVVLALGVVAVVVGDRLPAGVDATMERIVGVTLLVLGAYVFYALVRHGRDFRMRSRWMLLFAGSRRGWRWLRAHLPNAPAIPEELDHTHGHRHPHAHVHDDEHHLASPHDATMVATVQTHEHRHRHVATMPDDPFLNYGKGTAMLVGMIHGVGAETPTQLLLFLAAAGVAGRGGGVLLLVTFLA